MTSNGPNRWQRLAATLVILFHLTVIGVHNIWASLEGWSRSREASDVSATATAMLQTMQQAALSPLIHGYARFTGLNTGYTFFAPQVGSFYHYEVACFGPDGTSRDVVYRPALSGTQGYLRYQNFLEVFHVLHSEDPAEDSERRYARAVAKSMAKHLLPDPACSQYRIKVGVYAPRSLRGPSTAPLLAVFTLYADTLITMPSL
ncbi:hypothetical protein [Parapedobacter defluvii]|uniref:hypothetical protein n=1 Tax=Parapedobacter defluvii TaxID=2045106 RepID=UPI00333FBD88